MSLDRTRLARTSTSSARKDRARVRDAYDTARYERLAGVKADHDPTSLFRLNHNVEPAV
jgi:hypothetical protein